MALDFKSESEVKEFLHNLGIEYRFGCYSEKKPEVCHLLGDYLEAVKKDYEKARKVYKANCDDYHFGRSCLKFGSYSLMGKAGLQEDFKTAYQYFKKGCDKDEATSCFNEGLLSITSHDKCEIEENPVKGMSLLEKACDGGNASGCYYASGFFISGLKKKSHGNDKNVNPNYAVPKNMERAYEYAVKGCDLRNVFCCVNLSQMYAKGEGVEKNEELAIKYKKIALELQSEMDETSKTLTFQEGIS